MAPLDTENDVEESKAESEPYHSVLEKIGHDVFKNDCLDRRLKRHHITGTFSLENNALRAYNP